MKKFWKFTNSADDGRVLELNGPIDDEVFWGDEITPADFRDELEADEGDVKVIINSPGGNVFAAAEMYDMLRAHKGKVTVSISSLAASAASVVAMAGDTVEISPVGLMMIHNPSTMAWGDHKDFSRTIETLDQVKESIINAYTRKTHLSREHLADLMDNETWMNAQKALELGFVDRITGDEPEVQSMMFAVKAANAKVFNKITAKLPEEPKPEPAEEPVPPVEDAGTPAAELTAKLETLKKFM